MDTSAYLAHANALTTLGLGEPAWQKLLAGECGLRPADEVFPGYDQVGTGSVGLLAGSPMEQRLPALFGQVQIGLIPKRPRCDFLIAGSSLGDLSGDCAGRPEKFLRQRLSSLFPELGPDRFMLVSSACSSGTDALGMARLLVNGGIADVVGVLAFDTLEAGKLLQHVALGTQSRNQARPFDSNRDGTSFGEGAAFAIVASRTGLRRLGAEPLARVAGFGMSCDALDITAPDPTGHWPSVAIERALASAGACSRQIGYVNAHGSGTRLNDLVEGMALRQAFGSRLDGIPVSSTKGAVGHLLGATGLVEAVFSAWALRDGVCPGTTGLEEADPAIPLRVLPKRKLDLGTIGAVMSVNFGFGGVNSAVVLASP